MNGPFPGTFTLSILRTLGQSTVPPDENTLFIINNNPSEKLGKKIFLQTFLSHNNSNYHRIIALCDSGSDLSIIQIQILKNLFNDEQIDAMKTTTPINTIKSYSQNTIKILFHILIHNKFHSSDPPAIFQITVIDEIQGVPPILFSADLMRQTLMNIAYVGNHNDPDPAIQIHYPVKRNIICFHATENEINTCQTSLHLQPFESKTVKFILHSAAPCISNNNILITDSLLNKDIVIYASKSQLFYDSMRNSYYAFALIENISPKRIVNEILLANIEILADERVIPITKSNFHKLKNVKILHDVSLSDT